MKPSGQEIKRLRSWKKYIILPWIKKGTLNIKYCCSFRRFKKTLVEDPRRINFNFRSLDLHALIGPQVELNAEVKERRISARGKHYFKNTEKYQVYQRSTYSAINKYYGIIDENSKVKSDILHGIHGNRIGVAYSRGFRFLDHFSPHNLRNLLDMKSQKFQSNPHYTECQSEYNVVKNIHALCIRPSNDEKRTYPAMEDYR